MSSDRELLKLMKQGGEQICDYAIRKWLSGKYNMSDDETDRYVDEWRRRKAGIVDLAKRVRGSGLLDK